MTQANTQESGHLAAIDLGSNSFHMIVARQDHNEIRPIERLGEKVQLAAGLDAYNRLDRAAMERGWSCLRKFAQYIDGMPRGTVRVVGTNALRQARNRDLFTEKAAKILGHPVEVIAGREEARLIYLGVAHTRSDDTGSRLVVDIGGGSTEFIVGERFETRLLESLHMGCVSYSERFFPGGRISEKALEAVFYAARLELLNIQQAYRDAGWTNAVGSSGTIKSIQIVLDELGLGDDGITREGLAHLKQQVLQFDYLDEVQLPGLRPERAAIFPAGLAILTAAFESLRIDSMVYSSGALREGVLYDMVGRLHHEDVRERSVKAMMERYHVDRTHAERVEQLVLVLFDQIAEDWQLDPELDRSLLNWAALLHEVGLDISHVHFHKHGAYLLKHTDLMGFTRKEQRDLAMLVRVHRRSFPRKRFLEIPDEERDQRIIKLCAILRLAVVLNHSRKDKPHPEYRLTVIDRNIHLQMEPGWLDTHPLTWADLQSEALYLAQVGYGLSIS